MRVRQGRTVGLSLCPAWCHGPGRACLPGLPGEGPGPLCHLGLACLQAQPARQTRQTPPQGFCVCTQSLHQPLPEGGEGGGPPGGHQGRGKERPGGSVTAEERAKGWRQRAGQARGRATPERRTGGRQAVPGETGPRAPLTAVQCGPLRGTPCGLPPASQRRPGPESWVQHLGWGTSVPLGPTPGAWQTRRRP